MPDSEEFLIILFFSFKYALPLLLFVPLLFFGIKLNYIIRISCGDHIHNQPGMERQLGFMIGGILSGIVACTLLYSFNVSLAFIIPLAVMLAPSPFLINLPYNRGTRYVRVVDGDGNDVSSPNEKSGDAVTFTYLLFACIIMYVYLGYSGISRYYGNLIYVTQSFMALLLFFMLLGYGAGRLLRLRNLFIYGESFFPVTFLLFLILLMSFNGRMEFISGLLLFAPVAVLIGVLLHHTMSALTEQYDADKRATVAEFSFLILPAPLVISLCLVSLTNLWFFGIMCVVMIINVVVPAISIVNSGFSGYRKGLYFFLSLFFLPMFIFIILFFRISLDNSMYVTRVSNFEELKTVNYNADYIRNQATVRMSGHPVFAISDSVVRNYKRALVPLALYLPRDKKVLFIDGNQRFFRNPVIGFFRYSLCLDELSDRDVDFNKLPFSGSQKYVPDAGPFLGFAESNRTRFFSIVDIPNQLDQTMNAFRFSREYYGIVKKHMDRSGIFAQVFVIPGCRPELLASALSNLKRSFKGHAVYYFSNILVIIASDDPNALAIDQDSYGRLISFYNSHDELNRIFMNEPHVCSHLVTPRLDELLPDFRIMSFSPYRYLQDPGQCRLKKTFLDDFVRNNKRIFD